MKRSFFAFLLVILAVAGVKAQTAPEPAPDLAVVDVKWKKVEFNPRLEADPLAVNERQRTLQKAQEQVVRDNIARQNDDLPLRQVPLTVASEQTKQPPTGLIVSYVYSVTVKNTGAKSVQKVFWRYESYDAAMKQFIARRDYQTNRKIRPGETKRLVAQSMSPPSYSVNTKKTDQPANRVLIQRIEFTDGTFWVRKAERF